MGWGIQEFHVACCKSQVTTKKTWFFCHFFNLSLFLGFYKERDYPVLKTYRRWDVTPENCRIFLFTGLWMKNCFNYNFHLWKGKSRGRASPGGIFMPPLTCFLPPAPTVQADSVFAAHYVCFRFITRLCDFRFQSSILALVEQRNFRFKRGSWQPGYWTLRSMKICHPSHHENFCAR